MGRGRFLWTTGPWFEARRGRHHLMTPPPEPESSRRSRAVGGDHRSSGLIIPLTELENSLLESSPTGLHDWKLAASQMALVVNSQQRRRCQTGAAADALKSS